MYEYAPEGERVSAIDNGDRFVGVAYVAAPETTDDFLPNRCIITSKPVILSHIGVQSCAGLVGIGVGHHQRIIMVVARISFTFLYGDKMLVVLLEVSWSSW